MFYVSCMCEMLVREDKDTFLAQFKTTVIQLKKMSECTVRNMDLIPFTIMSVDFDWREKKDS